MYIDPRESEDGQFYFVLVGDNGEDQMTSETYPTVSNRNRGIKDVVEGMAGVLADEGYTVCSPDKPNEPIVGPLGTEMMMDESATETSHGEAPLAESEPSDTPPV